jgi:predicted amino acid dehydrogenase
MKGRVEEKLQEMWEAECEGADHPGPFSAEFLFQRQTTVARRVVNALGDEDRAAIEVMLSEKKDQVPAEVKQE